MEKQNKHTNEVREREPAVGDDALDLVELGQMRRVHGLVAEDAVDGEQLRGPEPILARLPRPRHGRACVRALGLHRGLGGRICALPAARRGELPEHRGG